MSTPNLDSCHFTMPGCGESSFFADPGKTSIAQSLPRSLLRGEQTRIDSPLQKMIENSPAMLLNGKPKSRMREFLSVPLPEKPTPTQKEKWAKRFDDLAEALELDGKAQVEIRFNNLDYDLIWKLQAEDLMDEQLTLQTKASIRIVMGTILISL